MNTGPALPPTSHATIDMLHRTVERYQRRLGPTIEGAPPRLSPLDAFLLHLVVEFSPQPVFVADLACDATSGCGSLVCLANPRTTRVAIKSQAAPRRIGGGGFQQTLAEFVRESFDREPEHGLIELGPVDPAIDSIRRILSPHEMPLFLVDAADYEQAHGWKIEQILAECSNALILVVNVGNVGDCSVAQRLVGACRNDSPHRLWRMADVGESLWKSRLCVIASRRHPCAEPLVERIGHYFRSNFDYLDLVRDSCRHAMEQGIVEKMELEVEALRKSLTQSEQEPCHPVKGPLDLRNASRVRLFFAPANSKREYVCRTFKRSFKRCRRFLQGKATPRG